MDAIDLFINGGVFMWPIFACLILGISYSLYKFILLYKNRILLRKNEYYQITETEIFHADIINNEVQKIYASEKDLLDKGMTILSTLISLAPMLGFTGTVYGMIIAFQNIKRVKDINPAIVAEGIETALLTTLFGLIVAMLLQVFYNMFSTWIHQQENSIIEKLLNASNRVLKRLGD